MLRYTPIINKTILELTKSVIKYINREFPKHTYKSKLMTAFKNITNGQFDLDIDA